MRLSLCSLKVVLFITAWSLSAQVTYEKIEFPRTFVSAQRISVSPDDRVWISYNNGDLAVEESPDSGKMNWIGATASYGLGARMLYFSNVSQLASGSFAPQNGVSYIGELNTSGGKGKYRNTIIRIDAKSFKLLCEVGDIMVSGKPVPDIFGGITPSADGKTYAFGTDKKVSTIYTLIEGTCGLNPVLTIPGEIYGVWKMADGFLAEMNVGNGYSTEVALIGADGSMKTLVGTDGATIVATTGYGVAVDWFNQTAIAGYRDRLTDRKNHLVFRDKKGTLKDIPLGGSASEKLLAAPAMYIFGLNGDWALVGAGLYQDWTQDLVQINVVTGKSFLVASRGQIIFGQAISSIWKGGANITSKGVVTFGPSGQQIYRARIDALTPIPIPVPTLDQMVSFPVGSAITLTGKNLAPSQTVTTVLVNGKSTPFSILGVDKLALTVPPTTAGTYTVQVRLDGSGQTQMSNIINLTLYVPLPPPIIQAVTKKYYGGKAVPETRFATGALVTVWGTNLCPDFPQVLGGLLRNGTMGCMITLIAPNGQPYGIGGFYYMSPTQLDLEFPFVQPGQYKLAVRNGDKTGTLDIQIASVKLNTVVYLRNAVDYVGMRHSDGSFVEPSNPAKSGQYISLYLTGLGETNPQVPNGETAPVPVTAKVSVLTDGIPAEILYAGLQGTFPGLYQVNVKVPDGLSEVSEIVVSAEGADGERDEERLPVEK